MKPQNNGMLKTVWITIAAVLLITLILVGLYFAPQLPMMLAGNDVAKVGNESISKQEFNFYLSGAKMDMLSQSDQQYQGKSAQELANASKSYDWANQKVSGENAIDYVKAEALKRAAQMKIQVEKAKEKGFKLEAADTKKVDDFINESIIKPNNNSRTDADKAIMEIYNVSLDDYKNIYLELVLANKYSEDYTNSLKPTQDELKKFYDQYKKNIDTATVQHVLILAQDANKEPLNDVKKTALKKAEDILARAEKKEDFATLAKTYSEDPGSKDKGGEYTFSPNGQMVPEFENWTFSSKTKVGDFGIVKTSYGYHVMYLKSRSDSYEPNKDKVLSGFKNIKFSDALTAWAKETKYAPQKNATLFNSIK